MPGKRYKIRLTEEERREQIGMIEKGKERARLLAHARILLEADESRDRSRRKDADISEMLHVSVSTIERVRKQCVEEGLERALNHKRPYQTRTKKLDGVAEAKLIQLACTQAPEGRSRWTMELLADELVGLKVVESIAPETVRQGLKKMSLNPG